MAHHEEQGYFHSPGHRLCLIKGSNKSARDIFHHDISLKGKRKSKREIITAFRDYIVWWKDTDFQRQTDLGSNLDSVTYLLGGLGKIT